MNITADDLYLVIGKLTIENSKLREHVNALTEDIKAQSIQIDEYKNLLDQSNSAVHDAELVVN